MLLRFQNEAEWLDARKKDVTSSEVAALFGLHPHKSRLRLWHEKKKNIEPDFEENNHTKWGRRLQIPVGVGICEDEGWSAEDLTGLYSRDPVRRIGASFDIKAIPYDLPPGVLEVKVAEKFTEDNGWTKTSAPLYYEFQLMGQLHLIRQDDPSITWGAIGTLGARQATRLYRREYDAAVGALIDEESASFWDSIERNIEPKPDYAVDSEILEKLRKPLRAGDVINLTGNNRAHELIGDYEQKRLARAELLKQIEPLDAALAAIKGELHSIIGRNEKAIIGDYQVSARMQETEERINYGSSWRRFDVSKRRK